MSHPPAILGLIAEPIRWQLLRELARSDRRVGELTEAIARPQNLVSYHLRELRKAGVVDARRSSADGRDVYYRADLARCRELLGSAGAGIHPSLELGGAAGGREKWARSKVLFLCTGNSARSQMAAALIEHRSSHAVSARSAGSHPKPLHPFAVDAMAARGIDISQRKATHLDRYVRTHFDRVITMCDKVREVCPDFPGEPLTSHWSIPDPAADGTYEAFEAAARHIEARIDLLITEMTQPKERGRDGD